MRLPRPSAAALSANALTLVIGSGGALAFAWLGLPAPFLTGPAVAVTLAALCGANVAISPGLRDAVILVLGIGIGSTVTPEVVAGIARWPLSFVGLALCLGAIIWAGRVVLARRHGFDPLSALLAATPGHLSYVIALSETQSGDTARITLVQSLRVLILTLVVPAAVALAGLELPGLPAPATMGPAGIAISTAAALAVGLVMMRLGVPAPLLIGGIAATAGLHGSGAVPGQLPPALAMAAFVAMGSLIGTRFAGQSWTATRAALGAGVALTAVAMGVAAAAALPVAALLGLPMVQVLIAFAPGGIEAMAAMALITGADPAYVAAHHVARLMLLTVLVPVLLRRLAA